MQKMNSFGAATTLRVKDQQYRMYSLEALEKAHVAVISRIPYSIKILLENLLRSEDGRTVKHTDVEYVAKWNPAASGERDQFPARSRSAPGFHRGSCVVDLAAMRDALKTMGADPKSANPLIPVDLVIDHSVQVDKFGSNDAFGFNALLEFQRNQERYAFLRWGQSAFQDFRVVPPDTGIVHQVNLEYLASVVFRDMSQTASARLSGHSDGHGLAHHHGQWARCCRLGRRWNRSRGLHARTADFDAAPAGGRL